MKLGDTIKKNRINNQLSQAELGRLVNLSQTSVHKIESGQSMPEWKNLEKICTALNTTIPIVVLESIKYDPINSLLTEADFDKELEAALEKIRGL
jgi:transcriptional regulator with XRE-family HTH domain